MSATTAKKPRLFDGREIKVLEGKFQQAKMFGLHKSGLYNPQTEGVMSVKDLDNALNVSKVGRRVLGISWCRSGQVGFYRRGFESDLCLQFGKQIGNKLVWIEKERDLNRDETGRILVAVLNLQSIGTEKVTLHDGNEVRLQDAIGMGVIPLSKLEIKKTEDNEKLVICEVFVASDFNPETDLSVKDITRPRSMSILVDADGIPLNNGQVNDRLKLTKDARFASIKHADEFEITQLPEVIKTTLRKMEINPENVGWFGSLARGPLGYLFAWELSIYAVANWSHESRVAIVGHSTAAPLENAVSK